MTSVESGSNSADVSNLFCKILFEWFHWKKCCDWCSGLIKPIDFVVVFQKLASNESVQVIVRCRPLSVKELQQECKSVVKIYSNRGVIEVENLKARSDNERSKIFTYDAVYDER